MGRLSATTTTEVMASVSLARTSKHPVTASKMDYLTKELKTVSEDASVPTLALIVWKMLNDTSTIFDTFLYLIPTL